MQSKRYLILFLFTVLIGGFSYAGGDVKIVLDDFLSKEVDSLNTRGLLKTGDKLFNKGSDHYAEALVFFNGALAVNDSYAPLNYKVAVCYLYSHNKKAALGYLKRCEPSVSDDYYYMLGRALHYNLKFSEAIEAYETYYNGLKASKQKDVSSDITRLTRECKYGIEIIRDSTWAEVLPLSALNSTKDEFQPFFAFGDSTFFFTSNRNSKRKLNEDFFYVKREEVELQVDTALVLNEPGKIINSKTNNAALSYHPAQDILITYNGKVGKGDLFYMEKNKKGELKRAKPFSNKINSKYKEGTALFLDLKTLIFSSNRKGGIGGMDLYISYLDSKDKWSEPENLGAYINTKFDEEVCGASVDGRTLYFTTRGHSSMGGNDVFSVRVNAAGNWDKPENMGYPVNTPDNDVGFLPLDTNTYIVVGTRPEGEGGLDMFKLTNKYLVKVVDTHFSIKGKVTNAETFEPIDSAIVTIYNIFNDSVLTEVMTTADGFFYKWFADKEDVGFKVSAKGYNPYVKVFDQEIGEDTLYFASLELTPEEIVVEKVISYDFKLVGQIKDKLTNAPLLSAVKVYNESDSLLNEITTDAATGKFSADLDDIRESYYFKITANGYLPYDELLVFNSGDSIKTVVKNFVLNQVPKEESLMFTGRVINETTGEPISAELKFIDPVSQQETIIKSDSVTGIYNFMLQAHHSMVVELRKDGYFFAFEMIPAPASKEEKLVKKDFALKPIKKGEKIVLNNILFETGKAILTKDSYVELDKLVKIMLNSKITVEISGHTDNTGGYQLNKDLSEKRAKSVVDYLISSGVQTARLSYKGYGPDQPVAKNDTKEGRAKNRRVEMKIID